MGLKNTGVLHQSPGQFCVFAAGDTVAEDYTDFTGFRHQGKRKLLISGWERREECVSMVSATGNVAVAAESPLECHLVELQL